MSSTKRSRIPGTTKFVRGPWKKGRFSDPELQAVMRKLTNAQMQRWNRAGRPADLRNRFFKELELNPFLHPESANV